MQALPLPTYFICVWCFDSRACPKWGPPDSVVDYQFSHQSCNPINPEVSHKMPQIQSPPKKGPKRIDNCFQELRDVSSILSRLPVAPEFRQKLFLTGPRIAPETANQVGCGLDAFWYRLETKQHFPKSYIPSLNSYSALLLGVCSQSLMPFLCLATPGITLRS